MLFPCPIFLRTPSEPSLDGLFLIIRCCGDRSTRIARGSCDVALCLWVDVGDVGVVTSAQYSNKEDVGCGLW